MIILLYTDKNCEYQAKYCIESFVDKLNPNDKIIYFTIGFVSDIIYDNLYKLEIPYKNYPTFHYYKAELSLLALHLFPNEEHFCFTDTDVLFSRRINFEVLKHDYDYPLASFGPHEYPFIYKNIDTSGYEILNINESKDFVKLPNGFVGTLSENCLIFNEVFCMHYFNVPNRSMRYVWSCFYVFNRKCEDFLIEYTSMCKNEYLLKNRFCVYPFHDETPFNVCLWKRKADKNLGFAFVNTHSSNTIRDVEKNNIFNLHKGENIDSLGADWEYIHNSNEVILYHGIKDLETLKECLNVILYEK